MKTKTTAITKCPRCGALLTTTLLVAASGQGGPDPGLRHGPMFGRSPEDRVNEEKIIEWCLGRHEVTIKEILSGCLQRPFLSARSHEGIKITSILRKIGFERSKDTSKRVWNRVT